MRTRDEIEAETSVSLVARIEPFLMTTGAPFSGDVQALSEQMTRYVATNLSARFTEQHKAANLFVAVAVQRGGASGGFEYREGEYAEMKHATDGTETDAAALCRIAAENVDLLAALSVAEAALARVESACVEMIRGADEAEARIPGQVSWVANATRECVAVVREALAAPTPEPPAKPETRDGRYGGHLTPMRDPYAPAAASEQGAPE